MNKKVFLYVRVSTEKQSEEGYSIEEQTARLKAYCQSLDWVIVKTYVDDGYSGATTNRPALQALIQACRDRLADSVVVYKLDRLSRSQKDTLALIEDCFLANDVDFISMTENFDTSTPFGKAMIGILSVFAQLEREQIKERMSMGKVGRAKSGLFHGGGYNPIGYDYIDGNLVINEYEAAQIRELHQLLHQGMSLNAIAREMHKRGYTTPNGEWTKHNVKRVLTNPLYIGILKYKGEEYAGQHQPIIDKDTFDKSQKLMEVTLKPNGRKISKSVYLSGMVYCGVCGEPYIIHSSHPKYQYFRCKTHQNFVAKMSDVDCVGESIRVDKIDDIVFGEIRKLSLDKKALKHITHKDTSSDKRAEEIRREIVRIDKRRARLIDLYSFGDFEMDELDKKISPLAESKHRLVRELESLQAKKKLPEKEAEQLIDSFSGVLDNGNFNQIRTLLRALIDKIVVDGDDITIYWNF